MPQFWIDEVLDNLEDLLASIGPTLTDWQGSWINESRGYLEGYKARATPLTSVSQSGAGKWEVTLIVSEPPDHSCDYSLVPFPRPTP